jgi:hypothetical protein
MQDTVHNLLFQETNLADNASESERMDFLRKVPSQRKIDAFLRSADESNPSPRFAEFYELQIAVFVAFAPGPGRRRVVIAGVTNITQQQFDAVAAAIGRGTARWNRPEFKDAVESILGIKIQDYSGPYRV